MTVRANAGNAALAEPSLTEIITFAVVPTAVSSGLPESLPVTVLKLAHSGLLRIAYDSMSKSGSVAAGAKS